MTACVLHSLLIVFEPAPSEQVAQARGWTNVAETVLILLYVADILLKAGLFACHAPLKIAGGVHGRGHLPVPERLQGVANDLRRPDPDALARCPAGATNPMVKAPAAHHPGAQNRGSTALNSLPPRVAEHPELLHHGAPHLPQLVEGAFLAPGR